MLLGQVTGHEVYRVDLSMIVSKYIGETEKNLARVFDTAERRRWILFFDEADALFGKRSTATTANDRHTNQEISYLLQCIKGFVGIIVLTSNLKGHVD
jgi:SpoVK/Ycf46/Vps4 family AAA+-type ATPase